MPAPSLKPVDDAGTRRPLVSVVMPTYNRPNRIAQTIDSLLGQSCGDFELLIRDDSRDDATERLVASIPDARIRYRRNPERLGMPGNLNAGIADSRGRYVAVCHDHDLYDRTRLEKMLRLFDGHPDLQFAHTGLRQIREDGSPTGVEFVSEFARYTPGRDWLRFMLRSLACPVAADTLVPRPVYERHGLYDTDYGFISDVEMWMRLSTAGEVGYVAEPLSEIRDREAGHEYAGVNWGVVDSLSRIHRRYTREAYTGPALLWHESRLALRLERYLGVSYVYCVRRGDAAGRSAGRQYIRGNGRALTKALTLLA